MKTSKWIVGALMAASLACGAALADEQVAGTQAVGVSIEQANLVLNGWSAKKSLLGKAIYNDRGEKVGVLHDIIVTPDDAVSFAIVAAHQFLGVSAHDVAVPMTQIDFIGGKFI